MGKVLLGLALLLASCGDQDDVQVITKPKPGPAGKDGANAFVSVKQEADGVLLTGSDGTTAKILNGTNGVDGLAGLNGKDGKDGAAGPMGPQGLQGPQGVQGKQGNTGSQGIQGPKGEMGATGAQGAQGIQGAMGLQGLAGKDGSSCKVTQNPTGATITCTDGTNATLLHGSTGAQGIQGPQGPAGICEGCNKCPTLAAFDISRGNPGACVNLNNGTSARMYSNHGESNYVTKIYKSSNCSGNYVATLWPNDDESTNPGDELAWINRTQYSIESLRDTNSYTLYLVTYPN